MVFSVLRPVYLAFQHVLKRTFTMKYPYEVLQLPETYRGRPRLLIEKCISCGLCVWICPGKALRMVTVPEKKLPELDMGRCCLCGFCAYICPTIAIAMTKEYELSAFEKESFKFPPEKFSQLPVEDQRRKVVIRIEDGRGLSHMKT